MRQPPDLHLIGHDLCAASDVDGKEASHPLHRRICGHSPMPDECRFKPRHSFGASEYGEGLFLSEYLSCAPRQGEHCIGGMHEAYGPKPILRPDDGLAGIHRDRCRSGNAFNRIVVIRMNDDLNAPVARERLFGAAAFLFKE